MPSVEQHLCELITFWLICSGRFLLRLHCDVELDNREKCIEGETVGHCLLLVQKWPHLCNTVKRYLLTKTTLQNQGWFITQYYSGPSSPALQQLNYLHNKTWLGVYHIKVVIWSQAWCGHGHMGHTRHDREGGGVNSDMNSEWKCYDVSIIM